MKSVGPLIAALLATLAFSQKTTVEVTVYNDLLFSDPKIFDLPVNGIPLTLVSSWPVASSESASSMCLGPDGSVCVTESSSGRIVVFGPSGDPQPDLDPAGKRLRSPSAIAFGSDIFYAVEPESRVIRRFGKAARELKPIKMSQVPLCIAVAGDGSLLSAPAQELPGTPLIRVYSAEGKATREFGEPLRFIHSPVMLNKVHLAVDPEGGIAAGFWYLPIIRRYAADGSLLREDRLTTRVAAIEEKFNLQRIGEGIALKGKRFGYMEIISGLYLFAGRIYVLGTFPRTEISELRPDGTVRRAYWNDDVDVYRACGLIVRGTESHPEFLVLRTYPDTAVDVFTPKTGS